MSFLDKPSCHGSLQWKTDFALLYHNWYTETWYKYGVREYGVRFLKGNYVHITNIYYFSDHVLSSIRTNTTSWMCVCMRHFKLKAQWSFFVTNYGKIECDGIGDIIKWLTRKQSLQQHLDRQIATLNELFEFCKISMPNIAF